MLYLHDEDADILHELEAPSPSAQGFAEGITYNGIRLFFDQHAITANAVYYATANTATTATNWTLTWTEQ